MSIEIGKQYIGKDFEVVEVYSKGCILDGINSSIYCICFTSNKTTRNHVLTETDFLEQYKPYEPVYEYQVVFELDKKGYGFSNKFIYPYSDECYFTELEAEEEVQKHENYIGYFLLDFTKRERKHQ